MINILKSSKGISYILTEMNLQNIHMLFLIHFGLHANV